MVNRVYIFTEDGAGLFNARIEIWGKEETKEYFEEEGVFKTVVEPVFTFFIKVFDTAKRRDLWVKDKLKLLSITLPDKMRIMSNEWR